ncbi:2855_t:CDS:2, partial [Gigaspora rosea]
PDFNPKNINYDYIADGIGRLIFASMATTSNGATRVLYNLVEKKQYWQELYQEAQEINKQCNGNELTFDNIAKM